MGSLPLALATWEAQCCLVMVYLSFFFLHFFPWSIYPSFSYPSFSSMCCNFVFPCWGISIWIHCTFLKFTKCKTTIKFCDWIKLPFSQFSSLGCVQLFATPWTAAHQTSLSITNSRSLPKLMSIESVMPSNHLILCHPLLFLPSIFPSIRVFSNESAFRIRWPKYWSFSFSISPSNEHRLVGPPCSPGFSQESSPTPQFKSSAFFIVQLSPPYMTTGKTIALTRRTFLAKYCLCFLIFCKSLPILIFYDSSFC